MNKKKLEWHCSYDQGRLDALLAQQYPDYSRSYFHTLIEQGCVMVQDSVVIKPRHLIKLGQQVTVTIPESKKYDLEPIQVDFEIVDQQPDFVVINKPAGLIVHPAPSAPGEITLVHGLLHSFNEINELRKASQADSLSHDDEMSGSVGGAERPGIVHRLDKDTSGLLLVARNEKAQFKLSTMFKDRTIHKKYTAVVKGHTPERGTINYPIGRHPTQRHKMSHMGYAGRPALSHYAVIEYLAEDTVVEVTIVTGRTHQIRVHMAAIGHPVVGDTMYGTSSKLIGRQALHASKCGFEYDGKSYSYECALPEDMQKLITASARDKAQDQL
jgi:23S rRNA pseudouridine1911/1915/1917 synthase